MDICIQFRLIKIFLTILILIKSNSANSQNVDLKGVLVSEPCELVLGKDGGNIVVDFGTVSEKTFYSANNGRTWLEPFQIQLKNCDTTLGKNLKITFKGTADYEQPDLLALSGNSRLQHLAVGILNESGNIIPINQSTTAYTLTPGNFQINFKAFLQASTKGITDKNVGTGIFTAVSTFELEYL